MPADPAASLYRQTFLAYVAGLLGDFDRYLECEDIDLLRDGVSYRMAGPDTADTAT